MIETDFQALYEQYLEAIKSSNSSQKKKCLDVLHQHIYKYPIRRYRADADAASEFYSMVVEEIPQYFEQYEESYGITFLVYLSVKLRNSYRRYLRQKNKETHTSLGGDITFDEEVNIKSQQDNSQFKIMRQKLLDSFSNLGQEEDVVVRLSYCFPLLLNQFRILLKKHRSVSFFNLYRSYLVDIKDWEIKEKAEKETLAYALNAIESELVRGQLTKDKVKQQVIKREKLITKIYHIKAPVTLNQVAKLMKEAVSFVHRRLRSAKEKISHWMLERYQELRN